MAVVPALDTTVKIGGTSTAMVDEATTDAGDHKNYQVTNAAKRALDWAVAVVVEVDGVAADASSYAVDYVNGRVTFSAARDAEDVVTVSGNYRPLVSLPQAFVADVEGDGEKADCAHFGCTGRKTVTTRKRLNVTLATYDGPTDDLEAGAGVLKIATAVMAGAPIFLEIGYGAGTSLRAWVAPGPMKTSSKIAEALTTGLECDGVVVVPVGRPSTDQGMWGWSS